MQINFSTASVRIYLFAQLPIQCCTFDFQGTSIFIFPVDNKIHFEKYQVSMVLGHSYLNLHRLYTHHWSHNSTSYLHKLTTLHIQNVATKLNVVIH